MEPKNLGLIRRGVGNAPLQSIPVPQFRDDYMLVRTVAIALNPTDWQSLDAVGDDDTLVGCDYSGIVEEVGKAVTRNFKKGDRVAGFSHGANDLHPEYGAFARYIVVKGDLQMHIPDGVSFEAAATVGGGIATTGFALYDVLKFPLPSAYEVDQAVPRQDENSVLIYGGSTATGTLAIQFAKLSGKHVITTCSPKHNDLVKGRGADEVFDYRSSKAGGQIRERTHDELALVLDTVNVDSTASICANAIGSHGGVYCNLLGLDCPRADVRSVFFLGYSMSREDFICEGQSYPGKAADFEFARRFYHLAEQPWTEGKWQPRPHECGSKGLTGVEDGLQRSREGKVSGVKLVYRVDETTWPAIRRRATWPHTLPRNRAAVATSVVSH